MAYHRNKLMKSISVTALKRNKKNTCKTRTTLFLSFNFAAQIDFVHTVSVEYCDCGPFSNHYKLHKSTRRQTSSAEDLAIVYSRHCSFWSISSLIMIVAKQPWNAALNTCFHTVRNWLSYYALDGKNLISIQVYFWKFPCQWLHSHCMHGMTLGEVASRLVDKLETHVSSPWI